MNRWYRAHGLGALVRAPGVGVVMCAVGVSLVMCGLASSAQTSVPAAIPMPSATPIRADVLIQAGHEGRPASCGRIAGRACNLGAAGEKEATPVVADEATRVLRAAGLTVARVPADYVERYAVDAAIFIHFDGGTPECSTGASVGFPAKFLEPAQAWEALYKRYFPYKYMPENFTTNLSRYYGYRTVDADKVALLIELGEITCPAQHAWLEPRTVWLGKLIARYVSMQIGKGNVPDPGPFAP